SSRSACPCVACRLFVFFFFQAEDGIRDFHVTGVQTCALPISLAASRSENRPRKDSGSVVTVARRRKLKVKSACWVCSSRHQSSTHASSASCQARKPNFRTRLL